MMKFNVLQFVSSMSADLTDEFNELEELIQAGTDAHKIHRTYDHLGSLIQGFEYMAEFIDDDEDRKELLAVIADKRECRDGFYPRAASIIYTAKLGKKVSVTWCHHIEEPDEFTVCVEDHTEKTFSKTEEVRDYIDALAEGEA